MRFEEVVSFPKEMEAFMLIHNKLGLTETEYLKLSLIERREIALAYRVAKKLGLKNQKELYEGYSHTLMFDSNGGYDLSEATMIIKDKLGIHSIAKKVLEITDSMEEFILKGDSYTNSVALDVVKGLGSDKENIIEHIKKLLPDDHKFNFDDK